VTLSFDMEDLGRISARLSLVNSRIDGALWAEQPATRALIDQHLDRLSDGLRAAGLAPGRVQLLSSSPVPERPHSLPRGLLSVEV
jgi:hypothetical protein